MSENGRALGYALRENAAEGAAPKRTSGREAKAVDNRKRLMHKWDRRGERQ